MPTERLLAGWSEVTPDHFRFTLKAPRRITHDARLRRAEESTAAFCGVAQTLGSKLGVLLFQLPPSFKKDLGVLDDFLAVLPPAVRVACEFRHASWHDAEVFVYFKHEDQGTGPEFARLLVEALRAST